MKHLKHIVSGILSFINFSVDDKLLLSLANRRIFGCNASELLLFIADILSGLFLHVCSTHIPGECLDIVVLLLCTQSNNSITLLWLNMSGFELCDELSCWKFCFKCHIFCLFTSSNEGVGQIKNEMSALNTSLLLAQFAKHASTQITIFALHDFVGSIEKRGKNENTLRWRGLSEKNCWAIKISLGSNHSFTVTLIYSFIQALKDRLFWSNLTSILSSLR